MQNKDGIFIDPELERDRFDFNVEPLTDEDLESSKEKPNKESVKKGIQGGT